jgi:hypothetical protein
MSFSADFWMPDEYTLNPRKTADRNSLVFLEEWQERTLTGGPGYHEPSKTFVGGKNGVVWVVRALLKCLANIGAVVPETNVTGPVTRSPHFDVTRLALNDWTRCILWLQTWLSALTQSNIILAATSGERQQPSDCIDSVEEAEEAEAEEDMDETGAKKVPTSIDSEPGAGPSPTPVPTSTHRPTRASNSKPRTIVTPAEDTEFDESGSEFNPDDDDDDMVAESTSVGKSVVNAQKKTTGKGKTKTNAKGSGNTEVQAGGTAVAESRKNPTKSTVPMNPEDSDREERPVRLEVAVKEMLDGRAQRSVELKASIELELTEKGVVWVLGAHKPLTDTGE